jgi:hypothetical protein
MRNQSITEVVEAGLEALKRQESAARESMLAHKQLALETLLTNLDKRRVTCGDPRTTKEIRDELWDFI